MSITDPVILAMYSRSKVYWPIPRRDLIMSKLLSMIFLTSSSVCFFIASKSDSICLASWSWSPAPSPSDSKLAKLSSSYPIFSFILSRYAVSSPIFYSFSSTSSYKDYSELIASSIYAFRKLISSLMPRITVLFSLIYLLTDDLSSITSSRLS